MGFRDEVEDYFKAINEEFARLFEIASRARSKGLDPDLHVEIKPARDMAERVEGLLGLKGLADKIRKAKEEGMSKELMAFEIAKRLVEELKANDKEKVAELAIRAALAILTDGITAAPLQGIAHVRIKQNLDGSKYLAVYYAGPIRSAGGTEQALSVLISDYVRQLLGLERYKPLDEEIERFVEELRTYERRVGRFQYHASDDEVRFVLRNLPVEVTGVPTDPVEVMTHRDLSRIETNKVRGGALRVVNDGIIAKARKLKPLIEEVGIKGWEWIEELIAGVRNKDNSKESKEVVRPSEKYLVDVVAGRPIFAHPSRYCGFRIRYGRARNTGLAAIGMNPATMIIMDEFLAIGTQVRTERPGKSAVIMPVDTIEGPIVKLRDGSVLQVNEEEIARHIKDEVEEIIFNGDILVAYGEFKENNYPLVPSGYVEEWWALDLKRAYEANADKIDADRRRIEELIREPLRIKPTAEEALELSLKLGIPLHPRFTYLWENVSVEEVRQLIVEMRRRARITERHGGYARKIEVVLSARGKRTLERMGIPHKVKDGIVIIDEDAAVVERLFLRSLEIRGEWNTVREYLQAISGLELREKVTIGTGLRMGRPEKAAPREMSPPVHALFPLGDKGGKSRSLTKAIKSDGKIKVTLANIRCPRCGEYLLEYRCPKCGVRGIIVNICPKCGIETCDDRCARCDRPTVAYSLRTCDLRSYIKHLEERYGVRLPKEVKCVKGLMNDGHKPEPLIKGILRAKYALYVFKDGTIRFDATNAPLTHFKPAEIGLTVEDAQRLGYRHDYMGRPLKHEGQTLELKVQDIVIPKSAAEYLVKVANFIDELLVKVYGLEPYYNVKTAKDLIGHLIIGIAPHTSAGVIGRIIGFVDANVIYAHPYWHAAKRRNCDGDEDAIILALDGLLNFSKQFLPSQRGGMMDAPLVLTVIVDPEEVDDEVFNMDIHSGYSEAFYEATLKMPSPKEVKGLVVLVEDRLNEGEKYQGIRFTHDTSRIDAGPKVTMYKLLRSMNEKIRAQLRIAEKIIAVDERDVAERVITHHLLPDIIGNLRTYCAQAFRCVKCNTTFRRPPLMGRCPRCGGRIVLTVQEGSVKKYVNYVNDIVRRYEVSEYLKQRIFILNSMLRVVFKEAHGAGGLEEYMRGSEAS
ncbi:MAG: DNA polymerase II large subunit [Thermoprotei archaeon]|nr:DNA polymerase II large subunit [Thermoprotei archaeon]